MLTKKLIEGQNIDLAGQQAIKHYGPKKHPPTIYQLPKNGKVVGLAVAELSGHGELIY
jgi:hypothetical protein